MGFFISMQPWTHICVLQCRTSIIHVKASCVECSTDYSNRAALAKPQTLPMTPQPNLSESFEQLVIQHQREIINFHYRFVRNRAEAEDLAQETFVKAYCKLASLKEPEKFRSWLYQIARNMVIDFYRRNKKRMGDIQLDDAVLAVVSEKDRVEMQSDIVDREVSRELDRCIALLAVEDQKLVKMLYYEGFSYEEMGEMLQINKNTLKSRLYRARQTLANLIESSGVLRETPITKII